MGMSTDGHPITTYDRSWAQMMAAGRKAQFNVYKLRQAKAVRFVAEQFHADGSTTRLGDYPTSQLAHSAIVAAAGPGGAHDIYVCPRWVKDEKHYSRILP